MRRNRTWAGSRGRGYTDRDRIEIDTNEVST